MEYIGIEIKKDSWQVAHLKSTLAGLKVVNRFSVDPGTSGEMFGRLRDFISGKGIKDPEVSIVAPRESAFARVLRIPAPRVEDISGILRFEAEKHLPFAPDEFHYGHSVIERKGNIHEVLLSAAKKEGVNLLLNEFTGAGLKPSCIVSPQAAVLNALEHIGALRPGKTTVFVHVSPDEASIDSFSGSGLVYSRLVQRTKGFAERLRREVKLALFAHKRLDNKGFDECVVCFDGDLEQDVADEISAVAQAGSLKVWSKGGKEPDASPAALGAALAASGKGKAQGLLSSKGGTEKKASYAFTAAAACVAALLLAMAGGSYIARDLLAIRSLESAISSVKGENEETQNTLDDYKKLSAKVALLEEIGGMRGPGVLDALQETVKVLPERTRLTNFETSGGSVRIEGITDSASSLVLTLEERSDFLEQAEMSGPVVKASNGKETFMLSFRIKGAAGKESEGRGE